MEVVHGGGTSRRVLVVGVAHSLQDHQAQTQAVAEGPLVLSRRPVIAGLSVVDSVIQQHHLAAGTAKLTVEVLDRGGDPVRFC